MRQLIQAAKSINETVFNPAGRSSEEILDFAEQSIFEIAEQESRGRRNYRPIKDLLLKALDRVDELFRKKSPITGVATGFDDLDDKTAGLQPADLIIVAGRPSMGKSALAINIAEHAAIKDKLSVAVFSMEMPGEQLAMRMMSSLGRIDQHKVRTGKLSDDDWPRLTSAVEILKDAKLVVDDTPALTPTELRSRCRRIFRDQGLDLVIVDYLQLMQVPGTVENRATEISEISRSLKAMAKELNVPVIALSQLNRSLEQRPNKRPVMSDLRESGAIEQDADVILFIYRDEVYDEDSADKGVAEIIIGKQRNGPIGTVRLAFLGQYTRFENYIADQPYMMGLAE
jgi:replicative DNA helicase